MSFLFHIFVGVLLLVLWLLAHIVFLFSIGCLVTAGMVVLVVRRGARNGIFIAHKTNTQIYHRQCKRCDGCGVTMLDGSIIPTYNRTYENTPNGFVQRSKIANTKTCEFCQGLGKVWLEDGVPRPIAAKRGWWQKWQ